MQAVESQPISLLTSGVPAQTQDTVLHNFLGGSDGEEPLGGLTEINGVLYGTAYAKGAGTATCRDGCGIVFKITTSGALSVLHTFASGGDGATPVGDLVNVNGVLYGTTAGGGTSNDGTVFEITTAGAESVLYSFKAGSDGLSPNAGLTNVDGVLYGTT